MAVSNELSSEGSNEVIPQDLANAIHQDAVIPQDLANAIHQDAVIPPDLANVIHQDGAADESSEEEDWNDIEENSDADDSKPVIIVLIKKFLEDVDEKKEEDPVVRELSIESVKNYATTTTQQDVLHPIPVQDVLVPTPVQDVLDPTPVKDKEEEKVKEKHSKKEKGKQIVEEKEKEAPANEGGDDDDDQRTSLEKTISTAISIAERKGRTVKILRYHGVDGVTQVMEELFNLSEVTFFVVEEVFAITMLEYVKNSVQMLGIPCVIYSENPEYYRYIWNDGSKGRMARRARELEVDIINSLVSGYLRLKFAAMRRKLRKKARPPDAESVGKVL